MLYGEDIEYWQELYNIKYKNIIQKFDCGNNSINEYLNKKTEQDLVSGFGVTKLFLNKQKDRVIGLYTLNCSALVIGTSIINGNFHPAVEVKMFAVDKEYQHIIYSQDDIDFKLSDNLFCDIIDNINNFTENICGASYIILYSVPKYVNFYKKMDSKNSYLV